MAHDSCPDIFGMCETFLTDSISDDQIAIDGYDILRKDESDTQKKAEGGVVLYFRKSINCSDFIERVVTQDKHGVTTLTQSQNAEQIMEAPWLTPS